MQTPASTAGMSMKRAVQVGTPLAVAAAVYGTYHRKEWRAFAATVVDPQHSYFQHSPPHELSPYVVPPPHLGLYANNGFFNETMSPQTRWNYNWDNREPEALVDPDKFASANEEERREMLAKYQPTATRHIFLVRHGQYHYDSDTKHLTDLGREQAQHLGKRMTSVNIKFDKVVMSTMTRATETATLMLGQMDNQVETKSDSMLEEGAPYPPEPKVNHWKPKMKFFTQGSRIEAAFRKYFHRASPKQKEDSYEIIVCHANVIRYFLCRALQFPPEGWLRLSNGHTGITWIMIRPNGLVSLRSFGDVGHLPPDKISFS